MGAERQIGLFFTFKTFPVLMCGTSGKAVKGQMPRKDTQEFPQSVSYDKPSESFKLDLAAFLEFKDFCSLKRQYSLLKIKHKECKLTVILSYSCLQLSTLNVT